MSNFESDPTQEALNEILADAGNIVSEDFETMRQRIMDENVMKGPGVYRMPGMVERDGHRVIVGNHSTHYVSIPKPYANFPELEEQAARMRELMGIAQDPGAQT